MNNYSKHLSDANSKKSRFFLLHGQDWSLHYLWYSIQRYTRNIVPFIIVCTVLLLPEPIVHLIDFYVISLLYTLEYNRQVTEEMLSPFEYSFPKIQTPIQALDSEPYIKEDTL